jgi:hypothetical protein
MASFPPLASGRQKISLLAPVRSGRRPSPEGTRSFSGALLIGIAREELQIYGFVGEANKGAFLTKNEFSTEEVGYTTGSYI